MNYEEKSPIGYHIMESNPFNWSGNTGMGGFILKLNGSKENKMKYDKKSTKWLERQIEKMKKELNLRKEFYHPEILDEEKRDFTYLQADVTTFINALWNSIIREDMFKQIFINALRAYYGFDIWEKVKKKIDID